MRARLWVAVTIALVSGCGLLVDPLSDLTGGDAAVNDASLPDIGASDVVIADADASTVLDAGTCDADLKTDPSNCGRCGHDCSEGCSSGICMTTNSFPGHAKGLAVENEVLYIAAASTSLGDAGIWSMTISGGITKQLYAEAQPSGVALSGNDIFWSEDAVGSLHRGTIDGGASSTVITTSIQSLAANSQYLYWTTPQQTAGRSLLSDGGVEVWPPSIQGSVRDVAANDNFVVYTLVTGGVVRMQPDGSNLAAIGASLGAGWGLVKTPTATYFATQQGSDNSMFVLADNATTPTPIAGPISLQIPFVTGDDQGVYWSLNGTGVSGCADPKCAGGVESISQLGFVQALAVDPTYVFFCSASEQVVHQQQR